MAEHASGLLLPENVRVFHIGPHKTATTAIQGVCSSIRPELLRHGVRYPGSTFNHRVAVSAFMAEGFGWQAGATATAPPPRRRWTRFKREIDSEHERRVLFGHEYASRSDDAMTRRWVDEVGPSLHVVITLRAFGTILPSLWQERLKRNAHRETFETWLRGVLTPEQAGYDRRGRHIDHAALVRRWAAAAGPDRVSVIALDPTDRRFVFHRFEDLLGLPRDLLGRVQPPVTNRSLTVPEAELFRRLNQQTHRLGLEWANNEWLLYHGGQARVLAHRAPAPDEARLRLPDWARPYALEQERSVVDSIRRSGVRLIGDPDHLISADRVPEQPYVDHRQVETIPMDLAIEALVGVLAAATGRDAAFERTAPAVVRKLLAEAQRNAVPSVRATADRAGYELGRRLRGDQPKPSASEQSG